MIPDRPTIRAAVARGKGVPLYPWGPSEVENITDAIVDMLNAHSGGTGPGQDGP